MIDVDTTFSKYVLIRFSSLRASTTDLECKYTSSIISSNIASYPENFL